MPHVDLPEAPGRRRPVAGRVAVPAATDPDARRLAGEIRAERLRGMEMFAAHLDGRGLLRPGVDAGTARDVLWLYTAPESYEMLVLDRGWSLDRFGAFLAEAVTAALLPDPGRPEVPASGLEQPKGPAVPNGTTGPVRWKQWSAAGTGDHGLRG